MNMRFVARLACTLGTVAGLAASVLAADSSSAPNWALTPKVKLELLNKLGTDALHIDVDSDNGSVHLTGTVNKRETKELADSVARSVGGVKTVSNDLKLAAAPGTSAVEKGAKEAEAEVKDAVLESKVRIALIDKLGRDGFKVGTEVASGVVTLKFDRAASRETRSSAIAAARGVSGVAKVIPIDKSS
jgi:osmotically-inducible protein OsmY